MPSRRRGAAEQCFAQIDTLRLELLGLALEGDGGVELRLGHERLGEPDRVEHAARVGGELAEDGEEQGGVEDGGRGSMGESGRAAS